MTALRVAPRQPGPLHVDSLVLVSRLPRTRHDLFLSTRTRAIPPSSSDQNIILMGFPLHRTVLPFAVHLVCSCRVVTIVYPMLAQQLPSHVYPTTHPVLALLYYYPVCIAAI
jgi:hypothetical protein